MKKLLIAFTVLCIFASCDDGDIIVTSFDFDDIDLEYCTGADSYVFFKINDQAAESLSLLANINEEDLKDNDALEIQLNGTSNFMTYRKYNSEVASDYFCNDIPPASPEVTIEYIASSGTATLTKEVSLDDNDGVEEAIDDDLDTDMDGIPNYYDSDDDGDNVRTAIEIGTGDEPQDTDGDGIADYLDPDDDGDKVPTRYEAMGTLDPTSIDTDENGVADYLEVLVDNSDPIDEYVAHSYTLVSNVLIFLSDLVLQSDSEVITQESLDFDSISNIVNTTETVIPDFN